MAWEEFLNHTCDLYHVISTDTSPGYSLPASPLHSYPDKPDEESVPCHFAQGGSGGTVNTMVQRLPEHDYEDRIKLVLPFGTDVRLNDKVVDHRTGHIYYAEIPRIVHGNHHIYVYVKREANERVI